MIVASRLTFLHLCLAAALMPRAALAKQAPARDTLARRSALAGVVRDSLERPIALATVHVEGKDLSTVSDDSGRFHLAGIRAGVNDFTVMRIGYKSVSFTTTLAADTTLVIVIHLRRIQTLEQVKVTAEGISPRLERQGFYERRRLGVGSFVTPERVDSLSHVSTPAQLLRGVRGLELRCGRGICEVHTMRAHDCLHLFVDGVLHQAQGDNQIDRVLTTSVVYAIEVYENPNIVPLQFQASLPSKRGLLTAKAGCGAIVVWTRSRAG